MIYIVFGEMAAGKNYVGKRLAQALRFSFNRGDNGTFFDGDDALPLRLVAKVKRGKPLTTEEVKSFVVDDLIPAIKKRHHPGENLVVAQALYSRDHRRLITKEFETDVEWVYIPAPPILTHLKRLWDRDNGLMWMLTALVSKPFFQKPIKNQAVVLINDETLNEQINKMLG